MVPRQKQEPIQCNVNYFKSVSPYLKLAEALASLAVLILALQYWGPGLVIFIEFVGAFGACSSFMWFFMYSININARFPPFFPIVMVLYHTIMALIFLAAAICSAMLIDYLVYLITMILCFVVSVLFITDTVLSILWMRGGEDTPAWPCC